MTDRQELERRLAGVEEDIRKARTFAGLPVDGVDVLAVTKTRPSDAIRAALAAGVIDIGENRVPEMEAKVAEIGRSAARWHLIGHLQRNKVRQAVPLFDLLHSLDSLRLARSLSAEAVESGREVHALIQINTSGEESKFGFPAESALDATAEICELPGLVIDGMMTMAPLTDDDSVLRGTFSRARALWEEAGRVTPRFNAIHLSMGMSNDYRIAVEEGSTLIRLGTALFGGREV
ncbi:MAG TPA: YggS family pyridoxal phosphate-dependent enzyme [Longimicrobiaceae bacterium]|nr:YggS family pyridoxal phosphate-dependent enzyme [Longimicrobiaceae bacterium]